MTGYDFGDIVIVPFPFTDQSASKKRPAVVISSQAYHRERPDLILMAVTAHFKPAVGTGDVAIRDWRAAGLIKPSVIKPVITTVEQRLVLNRLGRLGEEDRRALREAITQVIG